MNSIWKVVLKILLIFCLNVNCSLINDYPYLVHIAHIKNGLRCAGTIVGRRWVLTSANCLLNSDHSNLADYTEFTVIPATTLKSGMYSQYICPTKFIVHEDFKPSQYENDVALIKLGHDPNPDSTEIVQLATEHDYLNNINKKGYILSWFRDIKPSNTQMTKDYLKEKLKRGLTKGFVNITDYDDCKNLTEYVKQEDVCGIFERKKFPYCRGITTGPLMIKNIQIGIPAININCKSPSGTTVHTRVDKHLNWINNQMSPSEITFRSSASFQFPTFTLLLLFIITLNILM